MTDLISTAPKATNVQKAPQEPPLETQAKCENCFAPINGKFCSECGQSIESSIKYFWTVILHLLDDFFSFDSRASRTVFPLIFRPGFLTNRYFAGKRVHYVPPLRLYLFVSIVFFIVLKIFIQGDMVTQNQNQTSKQLAEKQIALLKQQREELEGPQATQQPAAESPILATSEQQKIDKKIEQLTYFSNLLHDDKPVNSTIAAEAIRLTIKQNGKLKAFTEKDQEKLTRTLAQIEKIIRGEKVELSSDQRSAMQISNNDDGTLSFDFLSKEDNEKLEQYVTSLEEKSQRAFVSDRSILLKESISKAPQLMFILLPLFAVILKIMFLFSKRLYMEHLTVALHSHSFIFLMFLILELLSELEKGLTPNYPSIAAVLSPLIIVGLVWIPVYLFIMQWKVYRQGLVLTTIKYFVIGNIYMILLSFTSMAAFIWGLTSLKA